MLLAVRISSYGCTWEVWRALKKLSCSPNFPRASITRYTHAKHEPILKCAYARTESARSKYKVNKGVLRKSKTIVLAHVCVINTR